MISTITVLEAVRKRRKYNKNALALALGFKTTEQLTRYIRRGILEPEHIEPWVDFLELGAPTPIRQYNLRYCIYYQLQNIVPNAEPLSLRIATLVLLFAVPPNIETTVLSSISAKIYLQHPDFQEALNHARLHA